MTRENRRTDFDLIRIFACMTILTIHFNASVSGYDYSGQFLYNNGIVPNFYFGCVYLGEIGNGLFFLLSGACLTVRSSRSQSAGMNLFRFWAKRAKALYPPFWIAFIGASCAHLLFYKGITDAPIKTILWSAAGMDGYAMNRGWMPGGFYQVGEWYLGCILLCYLVWPLIAWLWEKLHPAAFLCGAAAVYIAVIQISNGNDKLVTVRLCEMIAGGCFSRYLLNCERKWKPTAISLLAALAAICGQRYIHAFTVSFAVCWAIFVTLSFIVGKFPGVFSEISPFLQKAAGLTYPLFLVHHKLISMLASSFNLEYFPYRYTVILFIAYLAISVFLAYWLNRAAGKCVFIAGQIGAFCKKIGIRQK